MSNWPYYVSGIVFLFLVYGIHGVEKKYDKKLEEIDDKLDKLKNDISEFEGRYWELDSKIDALENEINPASDIDSWV